LEQKASRSRLEREEKKKGQKLRGNESDETRETV
jgi:hypothetical protein